MARIIWNRTTPAELAVDDGRQCRTLDDVVESVAEEAGVNLSRLRPMARLLVRTRNTLYRLVVVGPGPAVVVQGGKYFSQATEVLFCGSSLGGSALKARWIGLGFRMELFGPDNRVITSPVLSIEIESGSLHGVH